MGKNYKDSRSSFLKTMTEGSNGKDKRGLLINIICILIALIAVEILLGILVLKQPVALVLVVLLLDLILAFVSCRLNPYFIIALAVLQLIVGGFSKFMIVAIIGAVLYSAGCFAFRKFLE